METMEQRDVIAPSHINSSGKIGRVCLCVFTLGACCVPDGARDKRETESSGKRKEEATTSLTAEQTQSGHNV